MAFQCRNLPNIQQVIAMSFVVLAIWVFPKIVVPQNGWFIMEITIKMDDLGVPLFLETLIYYNKKSPSFTGNQKDLSAVSSQSCE